MKISEMTEAEKQALGTLVRVMAGADGQLSAEESAGLETAAAQLGAEEFWRLVGESGRELHTEDVIKAQARAVERPEARETIYGLLFGIAAAGSIVDQEGGLLDWLAEAWELETEPPAADGA